MPRERQEIGGKFGNARPRKRAGWSHFAANPDFSLRGLKKGRSFGISCFAQRNFRH
jgi:hypothetical protein